MRRVGVLTALPESDPEGEILVATFRGRIRELGWVEGRTIQLEYRRTLGSADRALTLATELVAMRPDVILVSGGTALSALMQKSRSVPTVFVAAADPVELGYVESLARPGGNATGFTAFAHEIGPKWLEILKEIAPDTTRVPLVIVENWAEELRQKVGH